MQHKEVPFSSLKIGAKFYDKRKLCIKTGTGEYVEWSTGQWTFSTSIQLVRPVKARVRIDFYAASKQTKKGE